MLNPELTLQQKAYRTRISYRFFDGHVEYTIVDSRGDKASFNAKYEDIPAKFDYRTFEPRRPVISIQIFTLMALALVVILVYPKESLQMFAFMAIYGSIIVGFSALVRRKWFRKIYTSVPTRNGKLLVLRDAAHDSILQQLEERRRKALRKFAMIDALNAPMAELRRLKWLKEEGAITALEFDTYRRALGPAAGAGPLPEPEAPDAPPLALEQGAFRFHAGFAFHGDYLDFSMNDGALTEFKVHYKDLPNPTEYRSFMKKSGLASFVLCLSALLGMALMNFVANDRYFMTPAGSHQALIATFIYVPAVFILVLGARRFSRREYTILPVTKGTIRVLKDAQHDRIVGEMQNRRHAALRARAVIDTANSPQDELRKFVWLREQGAITGPEFENFREKIMDAMTERGSQPSDRKPPTETLH
jgi:hypothetical protein